MGFQLSRGLIGQQAGLPAQAQPGLGQSGMAPSAYTSQQYNSAYATGQAPMGAIPGAAPGAQMSAGVAPYNNPNPQPTMTGSVYNTALKPEGDGNGFGPDQSTGAQPMAPKPKAAPSFSFGSSNSVASGGQSASGNKPSRS